jgi:hypothetical protein
MLIKEIFVVRDILIERVSTLEQEGKNNDSYYQEEKDRETLLKDIADYVKGATWLKQKTARERVLLFIENNFKTSIVAEILGKELNSTQASISHASKMLEEKLGKDIIKTVLESRNVSDTAIDFSLKTGVFNISLLLLPQFLEKMPEPLNSAQINLIDCPSELRAMQQFSHLFIQNRVLAKLDNSKMAFIRYIIESDDIRYSRERKLIFKLLYGQIDQVKDVTDYLQNHDPIDGEY